MKNAGLFEAIRIRRNGFPLRKTHAAFVRRFACAASVSDSAAIVALVSYADQLRSCLRAR